MAHRIGGRKLSRKQGPRLALYKNLAVSVLRYERVQTTEAKAKEIRGQVEKMITLAKRGDLAARRSVISQFPNEPLVVTKLFDEIAPKYADRTSGSPDRPPRPAPRRLSPDRTNRVGLEPSDESPLRRSNASASGEEGVRENAPVRYSARVEYDGTDFAGYQVQTGARTVQGELEAALARISGGSRIRVQAAGRTDAGVHAIGQVIAFTDPMGRPARELTRALNALLPETWRFDRCAGPGRVQSTPCGAIPGVSLHRLERPRSPLRERFALGVRDPLDIAAMERVGSVLVGRHDFSPFGAAHRQPVRTVNWVRVRRKGLS